MRGAAAFRPGANVVGLIVAVARVITLATISTHAALKSLAAAITGPGVVLILIAVAIFAVVTG